MFLLNPNIRKICGSYSDFNTSHVSIKRKCESRSRHQKFYFNTSHVSIKRKRYALTVSVLLNFNTSHVSIKPPVISTGFFKLFISIHPMFLLNQELERVKIQIADFNTSHVSIKRTDKRDIYMGHAIFQYIPCFY